MTKKGFFALGFAWLSTSAVAGTFTLSTNVDELTGETLRNIQGEKTPTAKAQRFPYGDLKAALQVNCSGDKPSLHIRFTAPPNLTDSETKNRYSQGALEYAIDGRLYKSEFLQAWGGESINSSADGQVLARLKESKNLTLRMNWYGLGRVHFKFDTDGLWKASQELLEQCGKQIPNVAKADRCTLPKVFALNDEASTWDFEQASQRVAGPEIDEKPDSATEKLAPAERKARRKAARRAKWKAKRRADFRARNDPKCRKY